MSTSARIQLFLGFSAALAAYLLLVVYNEGRVDLNSGGFIADLKKRSVAAVTTQGS